MPLAAQPATGPPPQQSRSLDTSRTAVLLEWIVRAALYASHLAVAISVGRGVRCLHSRRVKVRVRTRVFSDLCLSLPLSGAVVEAAGRCLADGSRCGRRLEGSWVSAGEIERVASCGTGVASGAGGCTTAVVRPLDSKTTFTASSSMLLGQLQGLCACSPRRSTGSHAMHSSAAHPTHLRTGRALTALVTQRPQPEIH
jgi:hypothetical protein